jgi:hypothetical protein
VRARKPPHDLAVRRALDTAVQLVGQRDIFVSGARFGDDCTALVRAALQTAGAPLPDDVRDARALHALAAARGALRRGRPSPGDVVFLSDRPGGPPEHAGLVESVAADGTALVLHRTERGVARFHVNVAHPWKARSEAGRWLNDVLIVGAGRVTAGRLVAGFATLL